MKADNARILYRQDGFPIFQNRVYETEAEARDCRKGDIRLVEDQETGLVYNASFDPSLMSYDENYQNEQGLSPVFQDHLTSVSDVIDRTLGRNSIVEVGCGKGLFLEMLLDKGFDVTGFDPAYEGSNSKIRKQYFDGGVGLRAQGLILRHVLEHIQNPYGFMLQLREANGGTGLIYIEVPCFDWICTHRTWFDIFFEHVNYFRISDFYRMFGDVIEAGHTFNGQYLYVVADLKSLKKPIFDPNNRVRFPENFTATIQHKPKGSRQAAIWGAASKGVIFSLLKSRAGEHIEVAIDINPAKHGKFLPGTGLQVRAPSEGLATLKDNALIYVMNSNYFDEIRDMSGNSYEYVRIDRE